MTDALLTLKKQVAEGKAVHAYLVEADKEDLPKVLKECAKVVLCQNFSCGVCEVCKKVQLQHHLDCLTIPLQNRTKLLVDDIAFLVDESLKMPSENGTNRVFLINASESTSGATNLIWQNKLLKCLEEPPKNVFIFLGVENADSLLATIVSRTQRLVFKNGKKAEVLEKLLQNGFLKNSCEMATALSNGNLTQAEKIFADNSLSELFDLAFEMLKNLNSTKQSLEFVGRLFSIAEKGGRDDVKNKVVFFLKCLEVVLHESVVFRLCEKLFFLDSFKNEISEVCKNYSLDAATGCIEKIEQTQLRLQNSGNLTVEVDNLIVEMLEVRYYARYSRSAV